MESTFDAAGANLPPMNHSPKRTPFWQFNIGHLLTILSIAGGLISLYGQRERDLARLEMIAENTTANMKTLTARIAALEVDGRRTDVMQNNIEWIRAQLEQRGR